MTTNIENTNQTIEVAITTTLTEAAILTATSTKTLADILAENDFKEPEGEVKKSSKNFGPAGVVSVINSKNCGKRIMFSKEVSEKLGLEADSTCNILLGADSILVGKSIPDCYKNYILKKQGGKLISYSGDLVLEITKIFKLDFSESVCKTYSEVDYISSNQDLIARIYIN